MALGSTTDSINNSCSCRHRLSYPRYSLRSKTSFARVAHQETGLSRVHVTSPRHNEHIRIPAQYPYPVRLVCVTGEWFYLYLVMDARELSRWNFPARRLVIRDHFVGERLLGAHCDPVTPAFSVVNL